MVNARGDDDETITHDDREAEKINEACLYMVGKLARKCFSENKTSEETNGDVGKRTQRYANEERSFFVYATIANDFTDHVNHKITCAIYYKFNDPKCVP